MNRLSVEYIYARLEEASDMVVSPIETLRQLAENPNCMALAVFSAANIGSDPLQNSLILAERFYQFERQGAKTPEKEAKNLEFLLRVAGIETSLNITDVTSTEELINVLRTNLNTRMLTFLAAESYGKYPAHITHVTGIDEQKGLIMGPVDMGQEFPIREISDRFSARGESKCRVTIFTSK